MPRAALFTLLVACLVPGSVQAQRAVGNTAGRAVRSGFAGQHGFSNRSSQRREFFPGGSRRRSFGSYFAPYDDPFGYDYQQAYVEPVANGPIPRVVIPLAPEPPIPKGQVIEIPGSAKPTPAKVLPPTVFILANGERLETRRFVLTASLLSISIDRQRRTVPLNMLDISATVNTNHERGIDLQIPDDRNEISVSF